MQYIYPQNLSKHVDKQKTTRPHWDICKQYIFFMLGFLGVENDKRYKSLILGRWCLGMSLNENPGWGTCAPSGCFLKWWYPQNTPKWSFLVGKPMVVGYHHFRKPPSFSMFVFRSKRATVQKFLFFMFFFGHFMGHYKNPFGRDQTWWFWGNSNTLINSRIVWGGNIMMALAIVSLKVLLHWQIPSWRLKARSERFNGD